MIVYQNQLYRYLSECIEIFRDSISSSINQNDVLLSTNGSQSDLESGRRNIFVFFGADYGGVQECLSATIRYVTNSFQSLDKVLYRYPEICNDLGVLFTEISGGSLFSSSKIVVLRDIDDISEKILGEIIEYTGRETILFMTAGELKKGSKLRGLIEKNSSIIGANLYRESRDQLVEYTRNMAREKNIKCSAEMLDCIVASSFQDKGVIHREIEKCLLFSLNSESKTCRSISSIERKDGLDIDPIEIDIDDLRAIVSNIDEERIDLMCAGIANKDVNMFYNAFTCFTMLHGNAIGPIRILLSFIARIARIKYRGYNRYKRSRLSSNECSQILGEYNIRLYGDAAQTLCNQVNSTSSLSIQELARYLLLLEMRAKACVSPHGVYSAIF